MLIALTFMVGAVSGRDMDHNRRPIVISHRGASGYTPEHSTAAYRLAADLKSDYIEPDVVLSKDGVFVAMHDLLLDNTTNIELYSDIFESRRKTKTVMGKNYTGYFVDDFTIVELKSLRLKQRLEGRSTLFDGLLEIPTFNEVMALAQQESEAKNSTVGIYVELKHPSYFFDQLGMDMGSMLLETLEAGGYATNLTQSGSRVSPIVIQCFEPDTLISLRNRTSLPLVQLINKRKPGEEDGSLMCDDMYGGCEILGFNSATIEAIAEYADGIGPHKADLIARTHVEGLPLMQEAQSKGLLVHPFTSRADKVDTAFNGDHDREEIYILCCLRANGIFTEHPDVTIAVLNSIEAQMQATTFTWGSPYSSAQCTIDCNTREYKHEDTNEAGLKPVSSTWMSRGAQKVVSMFHSLRS